MNITLSAICLFTLFLVSSMQALGQESKTHVYVWKFYVDDPKLNEKAEKLIEEFEEKLVKSHCYTVIERRDFAAIAAQEQNNKSIESVSQMTPKIRQELELIKAQMVIFGKLSHDAASGEYKVRVKFQYFDSKTEKIASVPITQGKIDDAASREEAMRKLMNQLCKTQFIYGNSKSTLYHLPECPGYKDISEKNRVYFNSETEAKRNGYKKASNCPR
jgi:hypothetical protein